MTDVRDAIERDFARQLSQTPGAERQQTVSEAIEGLRVRTPETVQNRILAENMTRQAAGLPVMTAEEQAERFTELMAQVRDPTAVRATSLTNRPIIGNVSNKLVYARQLWRARRRLKLAEQWHATVKQEAEALGEDAAFYPTPREARARLAELSSIRKEITDLERFQGKASEATARTGGKRAATTRRGKRGQRIEVSEAEVGTSVVQQYRGGEKKKALEARIATERKETRAARDVTLELHGRRTARMVARAERHAIEQMTEAVRQGYSTGEIASRILRRSGRGALVGAVAGLTAAGVAALAHHVATAGRRNPDTIRKSAEIIDFFEPLAKLADEAEQQATATRLAQVYRRWIDRLLGRNEEPVHLGDGMVEALGPGITDAYAKGLTEPPVTAPDDPRYRIDVDFDLINPAQRRHIAEYALDRIVEITDAQREAIRQAIADQSVMQGIGPLDVARTIRQSIGLTTYQRSVVASYRVQLEQLDPRALERELRDKRYDRTIRAAIEQNTPLSTEQVDAMTDAYHRKMLALRAQTIARTEALRATSYGGLARAQEVMDRHPELDVTKRWLATDDNRTRDTHRDLNGKEVDGMTSHFVTSAGNTLRWPLDEQGVAEEVINCRCTLQYIFKPKRGQLQAVAA